MTALNTAESKDVRGNVIRYECKQPPPIVYAGRDSQVEKLWNQKMLSQRSGIASHSPNAKKSTSKRKCKTTRHHHDIKNFPSGSGSVHSPAQRSGERPGSRGLGVLSHPTPAPTGAGIPSRCCPPEKKAESKDGRRGARNEWMRPSVHPRGWLRSTPFVGWVPSGGSSSSSSSPRLNRATLLRRARLDPQLAFQLQEEVEQRVRRRLSHLQKNFETAMRRKKTTLKKARRTVGSQTEEETMDKPGRISTRESDLSLTEEDGEEFLTEQKSRNELDSCVKNESESHRSLTNDSESAEFRAGSDSDGREEDLGSGRAPAGGEESPGEDPQSDKSSKPTNGDDSVTTSKDSSPSSGRMRAHEGAAKAEGRILSGPEVEREIWQDVASLTHAFKVESSHSQDGRPEAENDGVPEDLSLEDTVSSRMSTSEEASSQLSTYRGKGAAPSSLRNGVQSAEGRSTSQDPITESIERSGEVASSPRDLLDSTISDMSAQIAALLIPRKVAPPALNTDSVSSSYFPSDVELESFSSLSDMVP